MANISGWNEWGRHVLAELERIDGKLKCLDDDISDLDKELAVLKIKAGIWGLLGAAIPVVIGGAAMVLGKWWGL